MAEHDMGKETDSTELQDSDELQRALEQSDTAQE
jgi:hypothetical protein